MLPATAGVASPWFTGAGSKTADGESESFRNLKATNYKKEAGQGQTNNYTQKKYYILALCKVPPYCDILL
jgi:hypothetical protein